MIRRRKVRCCIFECKKKTDIDDTIRQGLVGSEVLCELENIGYSLCIVTTYNRWIFYKNYDDKIQRFEFNIEIEKNVCQGSFLSTKASLTSLTGLLYSFLFTNTQY